LDPTGAIPEAKEYHITLFSGSVLRHMLPNLFKQLHMAKRHGGEKEKAACKRARRQSQEQV
jgi:hypothetical protein